MKVITAAILVLASFTAAEVQESGNPVYGYLTKYGIPEAERIRQAEEQYLSQRIVGGVPAGEGQYPYQAALLISLLGFDGTAVCGGVLVSDSRVVTAAHCWNDGVNQAWRITVVLGTTLLFTGGTRIDSSVVATHPNWSPLLVRNDVAVIYLPNAVTSSNTIAPLALPSGSELTEDFANVNAIASGYGITSDSGGISVNQFLSHVSLNVITNSACSFAFPLILQDSNICTSGIGGVGTCRGDSGGPLVVVRNNRPILIGVTSFGSALGCQANLPAVFARVTSFVDFFNQHININIIISPVALPSGDELSEDFAGKPAVASGYGLTSDNGGITANQVLSFVNLNVTNSACSIAFPLFLQASNICTSGLGGQGTCSGDSGGPLVTTSNNREILIGVTSFGSALGCQANLPAAYARVTSYLDFFNQHM